MQRQKATIDEYVTGSPIYELCTGREDGGIHQVPHVVRPRERPNIDGEGGRVKNK